MTGEAQLPTLGLDDVDRLRAFHAAHFPGQHTPDLHVSAESQEPEVEADEDGLGYYADGNKRTLSDEQIKMFRHSEIHRLLSERRQRQQQEEDRGSKHISRGGQDQQRRRRFDDEVPREQEQVDTLMYDEQPASEAATNNDQPKKFMWPQLGP